MSVGRSVVVLGEIQLHPSFGASERRGYQNEEKLECTRRAYTVAWDGAGS